MAKFSQFLLVSDFDHTLTDHTGYIPQENLDAIRYFTQQGGKFTICTGRSLPASVRRFEDIPLNAPLLFCNGAGCYDFAKKELVFCHPLPTDAIPLMQTCEREFPDLHLEAHCLDMHYCFHEDPRRDASLARQHTPFVYVQNWDEISMPIVKFSLYSRNGDVSTIDPASPRGLYFQQTSAAVANWAGSGYTVTVSMPGLIEVQVAGTSKGLAARQLAHALDRPVLVCAGDAPNDLCMLQEADRPFYVSDGDSRMTAYGFPQCAPSYEGAIADIVRQLEEAL